MKYAARRIEQKNRKPMIATGDRPSKSFGTMMSAAIVPALDAAISVVAILIPVMSLSPRFRPYAGLVGGCAALFPKYTP